MSVDGEVMVIGREGTGENFEKESKAREGTLFEAIYRILRLEAKPESIPESLWTKGKRALLGYRINDDGTLQKLLRKESVWVEVVLDRSRQVDFIRRIHE